MMEPGDTGVWQCVTMGPGDTVVWALMLGHFPCILGSLPGEEFGPEKL